MTDTGAEWEGMNVRTVLIGSKKGPPQSWCCHPEDGLLCLERSR